MLTLDQLLERSKGIGASDIPILLGISPFSITKHEVWLGKCYPETIVVTPPTLAQDVGNALEPLIIKEKGRLLGRDVTRNTTSLRNPLLPDWVMATPDGIDNDPDGYLIPIEAKAPGYWFASGWGAAGTDQIPDHVYAQLQWQMMVLQSPYGWACGLFGNDFKDYRIEANADVQQALLETATAFWMDHVVARVPPEVDGTQGASRMVDALFPRAGVEERIVMPSDPVAELMAAYDTAREEAKAAETKKELAKQQLELAMGETLRVVSPHYKATWGNRAEVVVAAHTKKAFRQLDVRKIKAKVEKEAAE